MSVQFSANILRGKSNIFIHTAILKFSEVVVEIEKFLEMQTGNRRNSTAIHEAIRENSLEKLELALLENFSDLNRKNHKCETPFMYGLRKLRDDIVILRLLNARCAVNISNIRNQSALHLSVRRTSSDITLKLLQAGLDVNKQDCKGFTPLHYAVYNNKEEAVSLLLYYGASASIIGANGATPFAMIKRGRITQYNIKIADILFDYYDDFSEIPALSDYVGGILATKHQSKKFPEALVKFWRKVNHRQVDCSLYLWQCILNTSYSTIDWLRSIYLILEYTISDQYIGNVCHRLILTSLLCSLYARRIAKFHRISILWGCLSLGIKVTVDEFCLAHQLFGFGEEVEALLYFISMENKDRHQHYPVSTFILGFEPSNSLKYLHQLFNNLIEEERFEETETEFTYGISFFHLISKRDVFNIFRKYFNDSLNYFSFDIDQKPIVPSLVELSRNQARNHIMQTNRFDFSYEFHKAVENLNVPREVKEIVCFKRPIYR